MHNLRSRTAARFVTVALVCVGCASDNDEGTAGAGAAAGAVAGGSAGSLAQAGSSGAAVSGAAGASGGNASGGTAGAEAGGAATAGSGASGGGASGHAGTPGKGGASGGSAGDSGGAAASGRGGTAAGGGVTNPDAKAWYPQELTFTSTMSKPNPYLDVTDFKVTFTAPDGTKLVVPGFYTGAQVWKVRFAPTAAGTFTYVTSSMQDPSLHGLAGTAMAARSNPNAHGALQIDPAHPRHYLHADGTRPFPMGYELDWLGLMDLGDPAIPKARALIDNVSANGFNEIILNAYAHDTSWNTGRTSAYDFGPPAEFAWQGTNAAPDHTRMNEEYWENFDRVMAYLFEKGMTAHLFFRVYNKLVKWPANGSAGDDLYFRFIVARYQAYSNVVWDFSKESFYEKDHAYIASRFALIAAQDGYERLRTLHDSDGGQSQFSPNYYDNAAHAGTVAFYTDQSDNQYSVAKAALTKRTMPYYNAETTLYQIGNDGTYTYSRRQSKEEVFDASMEVFMAGGYFAYYYTNHAWDVVRWDEMPLGIALYKNLSRFVQTTAWYEMIASDALIGGGAIGTHCLATPGKQYLVYKKQAGSVTLNIAGAAGALSGKWLNLTTNAESTLPAQSNGSRSFTNPWNAPALLYLAAQ